MEGLVLSADVDVKRTLVLLVLQKVVVIELSYVSFLNDMKTMEEDYVHMETIGGHEHITTQPLKTTGLDAELWKDQFPIHW